MRQRKFRVALIVGMAVIVAMAVPVLVGCSRQSRDVVTFATPEEAVMALSTALEKNDQERLRQIFGPDTEDLLKSGDDVADRRGREAFIKRLHKRHQLVAGNPDRLMLHVGEDDWPLPIPLIREDGRWHFDGEEGAEAIVRQRIGANELRTIDVMHGYVEAQEEYAATGHDGAPAGVYAQRLRSEPGKHNGLYWEAAPGEAQSPAGPFLASATSEGYGVTQQEPYHGYLYRQLFAQGKDAPGGAREYLVDGKLTAGFALIAYPVEYGASGIMTFIVNQDGRVWQRDLGDNTEAEAAAIKQFDPDSAWTPLPPES